MEDIYRKMADIKHQGKRAALAIVVRTKGSTPEKAGAKMIVMEDGSIIGTLGGGEVDVYIEPIHQPEKLIIFGAGHITKALAPLTPNGVSGLARNRSGR
ncbi:MAG: XdhC family protein [Deltaproteobacteria bacterium]|nr:XdhC family protein [Deltaproteobacteria bacterium]